jgi:RNA polymerase sigma-70 factor (ECF subfamily)
VNPTSLSLLDRLKVAQPSAPDWWRLQEIYLPLIRRWLGRVPGLGDETADLSQDVFLVVVRELPRFQRRREGSFRAWLRKVTVNKVRTHLKQRNRRAGARQDLTDQFLDRLEAPNGDLAQEWDKEHDQYLLEKLLTIVQPDFDPMTWKAFRRFAIDGLPAAQVAEELDLTEGGVLQAKSRILKRLRQEAGDLLK